MSRAIELARRHLNQGLYFGNGLITRAIDSELETFYKAAREDGLREAAQFLTIPENYGVFATQRDCSDAILELIGDKG